MILFCKYLSILLWLYVSCASMELTAQDNSGTPVADTFRFGEVNDYRLYDDELRKIRLPIRPYLAIRLTKAQ